MCAPSAVICPSMLASPSQATALSKYRTQQQNRYRIMRWTPSTGVRALPPQCLNSDIPRFLLLLLQPLCRRINLSHYAIDDPLAQLSETSTRRYAPPTDSPGLPAHRLGPAFLTGHSLFPAGRLRDLGSCHGRWARCHLSLWCVLRDSCGWQRLCLLVERRATRKCISKRLG